MKVHLFKHNSVFYFTKAKTECGILVDNDNVETIDHTKITCLTCKKTQAFHDLEKLNNETKKAIEEMNEIKDEAIKDFESELKTCSNCSWCKDLSCTNKFNQSKEYKFFNGRCAQWTDKDIEPKTYKKKIEIEIDVPVGMEYDELKEIQMPTFAGNVHDCYDLKFKPKVKSGAELIGCLCGVSAMNVSEAKKYSENLQNLKVISNYENGYYGTSGGQYKHVYPVPLDKLNELKANLEREV